MSRDKKLIWNLELIWWVVTAITVYLVIRPILENFTSFKYLWLNILYIALLITYARYIFLLKFTFLAKEQRIKLYLVFFSIPLVFFLINYLWKFQAYIDNDGHDLMFNYLKTSLSDLDKKRLFNYIHTEMLFFGMGCVIAGILFPLRLVMSIWRTRNRGTV